MSRTQSSTKRSKYSDMTIPTTRAIRGRCPEHEQVGHVHGAKISACRACGHVRLVSTITGLCGRGACIAARQRRYDKRKIAQRAKAWLAGQATTV